MSKTKKHWVVVWCHNARHELTGDEDKDKRIAAVCTPKGTVIGLYSSVDEHSVTPGACPQCHNEGYVVLHEDDASAYARGHAVFLLERCTCKNPKPLQTVSFVSSREPVECKLCHGWGFEVPLGAVGDAARRLGATVTGPRQQPWDWRDRYEPSWVKQQLEALRRPIMEPRTFGRLSPTDQPSSYQQQYGGTHWQTGRRRKRFNQGHRAHRPRK